MKDLFGFDNLNVANILYNIAGLYLQNGNLKESE